MGVLHRRQRIWVRLASMGDWAILLLIGGWLCWRIPGVQPGDVRGRLYLLVVAVVASGALVNAWRRTRADLRSQDTMSRWNVWTWDAQLAWIGWLAVTTLAWALFGQGMLWDLSRPLAMLQQGSAGGGIPPGSSELGVFAGLVAIVVAGVTGYYLVILHRTTDRAEQLVRSYESKIGALEAAVERDRRESTGLADRETALRGQVLLPMLVHIEHLRSMHAAEPEREAIADIQALQERLRTEMALFNLGRAVSKPEFRRSWVDLLAFEKVLSDDRDSFCHLYRLALEALERLLQEDPANLADTDLREARDTLREHARRCGCGHRSARE